MALDRFSLTNPVSHQLIYSLSRWLSVRIPLAPVYSVNQKIFQNIYFFYYRHLQLFCSGIHSANIFFQLLRHSQAFCRKSKAPFFNVLTAVSTSAYPVIMMIGNSFRCFFSSVLKLDSRHSRHTYIRENASWNHLVVFFPEILLQSYSLPTSTRYSPIKRSTR